MMKYYYFGEFGYFNFTVLGRLYSFFKYNTDQIEILTFDDYFLILKHIFGDLVVKSTCEIVIDKNIRDSKRIYNKINDSNFTNELIGKGFKNLAAILDCDIDDWQEGRKKISLIPKPIIYNKADTKYVSVLCRNRQLDSIRNLRPNIWNYLIKQIKEVYGCEIIFHGLPSETIPMEGIVCSNIIESISYLNNSFFFISSMSGFAQFASNCSCNILQIGPNFQMIPYNPFNKININIPVEELLNFRKTILKFAVDF